MGGNGLVTVMSFVVSWQVEQSLMTDTIALVEISLNEENVEWLALDTGGSGPGEAVMVVGR